LARKSRIRQPPGHEAIRKIKKLRIFLFFVLSAFFLTAVASGEGWLWLKTSLLSACPQPVQLSVIRLLCS
jgi:hypothetical protein